MILQVHDELVFEVSKKNADGLAGAVKDKMENVMPLKIPVDPQRPLGMRAQEALMAFVAYCRLLVWPANLHMEYSAAAVSPDVPGAVGGALGILFLGWRFYGSKGKGSVSGFACGWFLVSFLIVANLYPLNAPLAEHWLYVPSAAFCLLLARAAEAAGRRPRGRPVALIVLCGFILFFSWLSRNQSMVWKDPLSLYGHTLRFSPGSARLYNNLGSAWLARGRVEEALHYYHKAIELDETSADAYDNLGVLYLKKGQAGMAVEMHREALKLRPDGAYSHHNLGMAYAEADLDGPAEEEYRAALKLNPLLAETHYNLGNLYLTNLKAKEALRSYTKAVKLKPDYADAYHNMGIAWSWLGEAEKAAAAYRKALRINPGHQLARRHLKSVLNPEVKTAETES